MRSDVRKKARSAFKFFLNAFLAEGGVRVGIWLVIYTIPVCIITFFILLVLIFYFYLLNNVFSPSCVIVNVTPIQVRMYVLLQWSITPDSWIYAMALSASLLCAGQLATARLGAARARLWWEIDVCYGLWCYWGNTCILLGTSWDRFVCNLKREWVFSNTRSVGWTKHILGVLEFLGDFVAVP